MGGIAQLVEHRPFKAIVEGSSPSALTYIVTKIQAPSSSLA